MNDVLSNSAPGASAGGQLSLAQATALVATQAVAVGIFLTPASMMHSLGSPLGVLLVWAAMGAMAWTGAWCYGRLAAAWPQSGGGYIYLRECFGPDLAFLYGWMSLWVMDSGVMAALSVGGASYIASLVPLSLWHQRLLAALMPAGLGAAYILSPSLATGGLRLANWLKLLLVASLPCCIFLSGRGDWSHFQPIWHPHAGSSTWSNGLATAGVGAFFALAGWWEINKVAPLVRDPQRNVPRALSRGVALVVALYILISAAFLYLLPTARMTSDQAFIAQAGGALAGLWGARILALVTVVCVVGTVGALLLTTPRVYLGMAQDGLFLPWFARTGRDGWPARITLLQLAIIGLLVMTGGFSAIVSYAAFSAVAFIAITAAGALRLPFSLPGARALPIAFLVLSTLVLVLLLHSPLHALAGVGIVLLGWPVFRRLQSRERRRAHRVDPSLPSQLRP